jgi:hypothetical protein
LIAFMLTAFSKRDRVGCEESPSTSSEGVRNSVYGARHS